MRTSAAGSLLLGTRTNDSAAPGYVGEYLTDALLQVSATALTTAVAKTIISLTGAKILTPGNWLTQGVITFGPAATTSVTVLHASISLVDNTSAASDDNATGQWTTAANVIVNPHRILTPIFRLSIAADTTVYLIGVGVFTVSTMTAFGKIYAWRPR